MQLAAMQKIECIKSRALFAYSSVSLCTADVHYITSNKAIGFERQKKIMDAQNIKGRRCVCNPIYRTDRIYNQ